MGLLITLVHILALSPRENRFQLIAKLLYHYYRPQTKFAKVMFSQVFVCSQGGLGLCTGGGSLSKGVSVQGGPCPGGLCQGDPPDRDPPPRTVTSGRYASYWNVLLFPLYYWTIIIETNTLWTCHGWSLIYAWLRGDMNTIWDKCKVSSFSWNITYVKFFFVRVQQRHQTHYSFAHFLLVNVVSINSQG